jgi:hypothetical protein
MAKLEDVIVVKRSNHAKKEKSYKPFNLFTLILGKKAAEEDMKKDKKSKK